MEVVLLASLSILSVVGVAELVRKAAFKLFNTKADMYMGAIIKSKEEAENTVRSLIQRIRWMELKGSVRLILIDKSGDDETREIISKIIEKFPQAALLSVDEMKYNKEKEKE